MTPELDTVLGLKYQVVVAMVGRLVVVAGLFKA
jgi:hypothetical protein